MLKNEPFMSYYQRFKKGTFSRIIRFYFLIKLLAETRAKGTLMEYALVVEPLNLYLQLVFILFLL